MFTSATTPRPVIITQDSIPSTAIVRPVTPETVTAETISPTPIDCELSEWTNWSTCSVTCGAGGFSEKYRQVLVEPMNGGKACARKLTKRKRCNTAIPCL